MPEPHVLESSAARTEEEDSTLKQAACLACRRTKVKCVRAADAPMCKRCEYTGSQCIVPDYHVGRYKGVKNKRSGLEKALYQVEEAVKKARTTGSFYGSHTQVLRRLLENTSATDTNAPTRTGAPEHVTSSGEEEFPESVGATFVSASNARHDSSVLDSTPALVTLQHDKELIDNNASNPLQLLAMASSIPQAMSNSAQHDSQIANVDVLGDETQNIGHAFFSPIKSRLDLGRDFDPIEQGLVTADEAQMLFSEFHDRLSHTRWGLDRTIHTLDFVRSRSCFLFASILAAASLFMPEMAALSKRMNNHCRYLTDRVISDGYKSVEIVLALMVNVPWLQPGTSWNSDDRTCFFIAVAMSFATDLSMNKIILPTSTTSISGTMQRMTLAETLEARRALIMDGHVGVEPTSVYGRRLLRARERAWLALFTLERGVCLARGRPWTLPIGPLIETCDAWHVSDIADINDGSMIASCVLRRDFGRLISSVRNLCDNNQTRFNQDIGIVKLLREKIEGFFSRWYNTWWHQIKQSNGDIPAYIDILQAHGKLSAYCSVLNHPTASSEVKHFFRSAGLTSALEVLHVAIKKESQLSSMPNNSVIMLSFAACFVMGLNATRTGGKVYLATHVRVLVERAADVLVRLGSTPPHRIGASTLFGKHIRDILAKHIEVESPVQNLPERIVFSATHRNLALPPTLYTGLGQASHGYLGFDSMTDDQLLEVIQNSNVDLDSNFSTGVLTEESVFMDWLDWPNIS